jgi:hypothetical protein
MRVRECLIASHYCSSSLSWDVKKVVRKLALATVFLFAAGIASATGTSNETCGWHEVKFKIDDHAIWIPEWECTKTPSVIAAPEMDPTSAIAALTLMLGSLAVLRGRRVKSPKA